MQRVTLICVGKLKEKFYQEACAEYIKRLSRHCRLEIWELPEQKLPDAPSPAQIQQALEREADPLAPSEEAVNEILDALSVPAERRPDFSDCRWYAATHPTDSRNRLYLGLSGGGTTLCVIESFL